MTGPDQVEGVGRDAVAVFGLPARKHCPTGPSCRGRLSEGAVAPLLMRAPLREEAMWKVPLDHVPQINQGEASLLLPPVPLQAALPLPRLASSGEALTPEDRQRVAHLEDRPGMGLALGREPLFLWIGRNGGLVALESVPFEW